MDSGLGFTEAFPFHSHWRTPFRLGWIINLFETPGKKREFTNQTDTAQVRAILTSPLIQGSPLPQGETGAPPPDPVGVLMRL